MTGGEIKNEYTYEKLILMPTKFVYKNIFLQLADTFRNVLKINPKVTQQE